MYIKELMSSSQGEETVAKREKGNNHHMKSTESPATSLLALTNMLQPVVRRCRFGCPEMTCKQQRH